MSTGHVIADSETWILPCSSYRDEEGEANSADSEARTIAASSGFRSATRSFAYGSAISGVAPADRVSTLDIPPRLQGFVSFDGHHPIPTQPAVDFAKGNGGSNAGHLPSQ